VKKPSDQGSTWLPIPIREALRSGRDGGGIYLVGGAVRDVILGQKCRDYDFVLEGKIRLLARRVADILGGDFYPLDEERQMMRVLWYPDARDVVTLDFAPFQGGSLDADLKNRDFTINAMAVNLDDPEKVIDPLKGVMDLKDRILRRCRDGSILNDPVRAVRAVRIAVQLELTMEHQTAAEIRQAVGKLDSISAERIRDELFRLLGGKQVATALRLLETLGLLNMLFPEIIRLQGVEQNKAHDMDVYDHSLAIISRLEGVLNLITGSLESDPIPDLTSAQILGLLGPYRSKIRDQLAERIADERTRRAILIFAALFHDAGKAVSTSRGKDGEIHNYGHETSGARIAIQRARALNCSNREAEIIEKIVKGHMRPNLLRKAAKRVTSKAIYRFFRHTGEEGIGICLVSLADMLAKRAGPPDQNDWLGLLEVNRQLLDAWYNHREERISPPKLVDGNDLMEILSISPGPAVGKALEAITEAQVEGKIQSREDAVEFIKRQKTFRKEES
jgi:tRNA nucleotidyltransferase/poly(A) polymerase